MFLRDNFINMEDTNGNKATSNIHAHIHEHECPHTHAHEHNNRGARHCPPRVFVSTSWTSASYLERHQPQQHSSSLVASTVCMPAESSGVCGKDTAPARGTTSKCPICLRHILANRVELRCGHIFCRKCLTQTSKVPAKYAHCCPLCREPHELDPEILRRQAEQFRQKYMSWRQGASSGARGEFKGDVYAVCLFWIAFLPLHTI